ncbi:Alpha/Beta hydrolase protein [Mycena galopus ATCC 62051]|nr:Alpha/Beta hydrolase protein [Mycena galopus ATCC 62051]
MPCIDLDTSTGSESFAYTISTPHHVSTRKIMHGLPTILLIHPVYGMAAVFHPIYEDPRLRRFNLVAMDLRGHGWTSAKVEDTYNGRVAAEDVLKLMEALEISACHVAGISTGASVALQMAIMAPEKMLSLFLLSPCPLTEPMDTIEGRQEIHYCWTQAVQHKDEEAQLDAIVGTAQMAVNNNQNPLCKALTAASVSAATRNWNSMNLDIMYAVTVQYFLKQPPYSVSALRRICCPISLVHCSDDIIYPLSSAQELLAHLRQANIKATLDIIEGAPHFGNATHINETNTLLYDFVLGNAPASNLPPAPACVQSPFTEELSAFGLFDEDEAD